MPVAEIIVRGPTIEVSPATSCHQDSESGEWETTINITLKHQRLPDLQEYAAAYSGVVSRGENGTEVVEHIEDPFEGVEGRSLDEVIAERLQQVQSEVEFARSHGIPLESMNPLLAAIQNWKADYSAMRVIVKPTKIKEGI